MKWDIRIHGDGLERKYADFIEKEFHTYKQIWELFIGNKGNATIADMENISNELNEERIRFSELLYTCLESLICLKILTDSSNNGEEHVPNLSIQELLKTKNNIILYFAHIGRINDMIHDIFKLKKQFLKGCDINKLTNELKEFKNLRKRVLHNKIIPFKVENGLFKIKSISEVIKHPTSPWSTIISSKDLIPYDDLFSDVFVKLVKVLNNIQETFLCQIESLVKEKKLALSNPTLPVYQLSENLSKIGDIDFVSGWAPEE